MYKKNCVNRTIIDGVMAQKSTKSKLWGGSPALQQGTYEKKKKKMT